MTNTFLVIFFDRYGLVLRRKFEIVIRFKTIHIKLRDSYQHTMHPLYRLMAHPNYSLLSPPFLSFALPFYAITLSTLFIRFSLFQRSHIIILLFFSLLLLQDFFLLQSSHALVCVFIHVLVVLSIIIILQNLCFVILIGNWRLFLWIHKIEVLLHLKDGEKKTN